MALTIMLHSFIHSFLFIRLKTFKIKYNILTIKHLEKKINRSSNSTYQRSQLLIVYLLPVFFFPKHIYGVFIYVCVCKQFTFKHS